MSITASSTKNEIKQFQLDLQLLGISLRNSNADGIFGSLTKAAAHDFADTHGITDKFDGIIPDSVVNEVARLAGLKRNPVVPVPPNFFDFTNIAWPGPRRGKRDWSKIDTIILHQTGVKMPADRPKRWYYFENVNAEGVKIVDSLHCQTAVTSKGDIYIIHPLDEMVWHSNSTSPNSVGIEVSGWFCGIDGDMSTFPGPKTTIPSHLTPEQTESTKNIIRYIKKIAQKNGSDIKWLLPHRLSSKNRTPDPGSEIWKNIAIPMIEELGLDSGPIGFVKNGYPIPEAWDSKYKNIKY